MPPKRPRTADEDGRILPPLRRSHRSEGVSARVTLHDNLTFAFRTAITLESEGKLEAAHSMMGIADTLAASLTESVQAVVPSQRWMGPVVVSLLTSSTIITFEIPCVFRSIPASSLILVAALAQSMFVSPDHSIVIHGKILSYSHPAALIKTFAVASPFLLLANTEFLAKTEGAKPLYAIVAELFEVARKFMNGQQTAAAVPRDEPIPQAMQNEVRHVSLTIAQLIARLDALPPTDEVRTGRHAVVVACIEVQKVCDAFLTGLSAPTASPT